MAARDHAEGERRRREEGRCIMSLGDVPVSATLTEAAKWLRNSQCEVWTMGKHGEILRSESGRSVRYDVREYV